MQLRQTRYLAGGLAAALVMLAAVLLASAKAASGDCAGTTTTTCTYTSTGAQQTFVVPAGVTSIHVEAIGGRGGDGEQSCLLEGETIPPRCPGGYGAKVTGDLAVTGGQTLYVEVGGNGSTGSQVGAAGGFNGGGGGASVLENLGGSGGGGGAGGSDIRTVTNSSAATTLASRLFVAAGGGGGGGDAYGGAAGGAAGVKGDDAFFAGGGGGPGTLSAGGDGGSGIGASGTSGSLGSGGAGGATRYDGGGGGGGGYYGGGGGGGADASNGFGGGGGGGGGSSWTGSLTSSSVTADATGTPSVTISYTGAGGGGGTSSAALACGYHPGTTSLDTGTLYTNATLANEATITAGAPTSVLIDCTLTATGTVTGVKVQGGLTASGKPSYAWVKNETAGSATVKRNIATMSASTLSAGTYRLEVAISGARWKTATGSGTSLTGGWSLTYTDSTSARQTMAAPESPLTINVS